MVSKNKYDQYQNLYFHPKLILEYLRCGTRDQGSAGEDVPCHEQTFEEPGQRRIPDGRQYKLLTSEVLQYNKVTNIVCMSQWAMMQFLRCEDGCHLPGQILRADQAVPPRDCGQWWGLPVAPHLPAGGGQDARTQETLRTHQTALQGLYMCHVNLLYVNHRKRLLRNLSYPDHVIHLPAPGWWLAAWFITPQRRTVSATRPGHTPALPPSPSPRSQPSWVLILLLSL